MSLRKFGSRSKSNHFPVYDAEGVSASYLNISEYLAFLSIYFCSRDFSIVATLSSIFLNDQLSKADG